MNKICLILPVLKEEKNISKIYNKIKKVIKKIDILFVEDKSTDKTRYEILKIQKKNKNIFCLSRKIKKGIGSAHKDGIKWCYKKKYKTIITMDADGTHDPKYIPILIKKSKDYDIVTTSRFKKADSLVDWPLHRKILTYIRLLITKILIGINFDASGAFRCFETKKMPLNDIIGVKSNHYDYFLESLYIIFKKKYSIYEVPIKLSYRKLGKSKMSITHIFI